MSVPRPSRLERDRLDRLVVGRAGVDEGPDRALRAIDLAIHAVKRVFLAHQIGAQSAAESPACATSMSWV
jgi:hypothetical protein